MRVTERILKGVMEEGEEVYADLITCVIFSIPIYAYSVSIYAVLLPRLMYHTTPACLHMPYYFFASVTTPYHLLYTPTPLLTCSYSDSSPHLSHLSPSSHQTHQERTSKHQQARRNPLLAPQDLPALIAQKVFRHEFDKGGED
jgi:hypothetical protein